MSGTLSLTAVKRSFSGLTLAIGLGLLLLLLSLAQLLLNLDAIVPQKATLTGSLGVRLWGTPLAGQVAFFLAALILLHASFGCLVWLLACMTRIAFPVACSRNWHILGWFVASTLWILAANAAMYPGSIAGFNSEWVGKNIVGELSVFDLLTAALLIGICICAVRFAVALDPLRRALPRVLVYGAIVWLLFFTTDLLSKPHTTADAASSPPNIIIIGIDSLRGDVVGEGRGIGVTPNIDSFLRAAHRFSDAITPLARTFPSWVSILSGQYPQTTGARENLMPRAALRSFDTLPQLLREQGYRTIFATDEVRFSNIDRSYGFDLSITPTVGAADFLLGRANDLPLSNMVANTRIARFLFPATYGNRAVAQTYKTATFIDWLADDIKPDGPTMLAVHLTLPHWPYQWADSDRATFGHEPDNMYRYLGAVIEADRQFGRLMSLLHDKELLDHSVVVLLSDHGEGLGIPALDTMLLGATARALLGKTAINMRGHGNSVLSPHQFQTLLAVRRYESSQAEGSAMTHTAPVSFVDIAPTLLDAAGVAGQKPFDGISMLPLIDGDETLAARFENRPRFTETGIRTKLLAAGDFANEAGILGEAAAFFRMNPETARIELRTELLPLLMIDRERAAVTGRWLLAAIPTVEETKTQKYVLVRRSDGVSRRITQAPAAVNDPEIYALWQAFHDHYGSELLPPAE